MYIVHKLMTAYHVSMLQPVCNRTNISELMLPWYEFSGTLSPEMCLQHSRYTMQPIEQVVYIPNIGRRGCEKYKTIGLYGW